MYYEMMARCVMNSKKCIRMMESKEGITPEEYDSLRVRAGMLTMLRTIRRVGIAQVYTQTILDRCYLKNSMKAGFPL